MNDGYYAKADIREVVAHAAARHVMIVPEIEMPGHNYAMLIHYPELAPVKMVERTGAAMPCRVVDLGNPERWGSDQDSAERTCLGCSPGPYVHLGGDEAETGVWLQSPKARAKMKELGLTDPARLQKWWGWAEMTKFVTTTTAISAWRGASGSTWECRSRARLCQGWRGESAPAVGAGYHTVNSESGFHRLRLWQRTSGDGQLGVLPLDKVYGSIRCPLPG